MPIGVPRIIYCWGEELPAQWTDIYNFIFRRRMIFLMQYLDDELCNQICGLLINIHMEDRSKELEKKESEKSNVFKTSTKLGTNQGLTNNSSNRNIKTPEQSGKIQKSITDLLTSEEDLAIDENYKLEQYTLQKITLDWLNWTANFFDYANEPYLFYLTEILAKDFISDNGNLLYNMSLDKKQDKTKNQFDGNEIKKESELSFLASEMFNLQSSNEFTIEDSLQTQETRVLSNELEETDYLLQVHDDQKFRNSSEISKFIGIFKALINSSRLSTHLSKQSWTQQVFDYWNSWNTLVDHPLELINDSNSVSLPLIKKNKEETQQIKNKSSKSIISLEHLNQHENIYSPFRFLANFASNDYNFNKLKKIIQKANFINCEEQTLLSSPESIKASSYSPKVTTMMTMTTGAFSNIKGKQNILARKPIYTTANKNINKLSQTLKKKFIQQLKEINENQTKNILASKQILKQITQKQYDLKKQTHKNLWDSSKKALGQRVLKNQYRQDKLLESTYPANFEQNSLFNPQSIKETSRNEVLDKFKIKNAKNYLNLNYFSSVVKDENQSHKNSLKKINSFSKTIGTQYRKQSEQTFSYRKQAERTLQEEELKKVFVIINSFGGSVGNGITVHDALQFIKAGSLTLALGVAASAASLALAGGTIGERYITEGCHTMIHQPEGSINGQASDILIDSNEIMKIRLDVAEIYSLSTYRPRHKILRDLDRDFYLTATETVYYGLADEIATNEVMQEIIDMTNKVWDYHESQQQRLLESRESATFGLDTQTQN